MGVGSQTYTTPPAMSLQKQELPESPAPGTIVAPGGSNWVGRAGTGLWVAVSMHDESRTGYSLNE